MAGQTITLGTAATRSVRRGHPWIWERGVANVSGAPGRGDAVEVLGAKGGAIGWAFFDPTSPIRARLVGGGDQPSPAWANGVIERALSVRRLAASLAGTDAMRLVHGEADQASGLVIDRYGDVATLRADGAAAATFWRGYLDSIFEVIAGEGVRTLYVRGEGVVRGDPLPAEIVISEDGARFEVDLEHGQKTGLFLDQRPNRRRVAVLAKGARVLNLCSYTGGFSIHAALGGAVSVTSVDSAGPAIDACRRNFDRSGVDGERHRFVVADVFDYLANKSVRNSFDLVVCDPPSFAPKKSARDKALRAYAGLNRLAISAVKRGGLLVTASCSSHVDRESFEQAVAEGSRRARREAVIIEEGGAGADHPLRPGFPEGDYLKVLTLYSSA